ncbi:MAG TPA: hypothetical protein VH877_29550 [Polyangia bacterium]|jgi:hypothetical protein|nr:hypothetical protein [Polyangia bacterium]
MIIVAKGELLLVGRLQDDRIIEDGDIPSHLALVKGKVEADDVEALETRRIFLEKRIEISISACESRDIVPVAEGSDFEYTRVRPMQNARLSLRRRA